MNRCREFHARHARSFDTSAGGGVAGAHAMAERVGDVDPGVVELSVVIVYTICGLGGLGKHRKGRGGHLVVKRVVSERSCPAAI